MKGISKVNKSFFFYLIKYDIICSHYKNQTNATQNLAKRGKWSAEKWGILIFNTAFSTKTFSRKLKGVMRKKMRLGELCTTSFFLA